MTPNPFNVKRHPEQRPSFYRTLRRYAHRTTIVDPAYDARAASLRPKNPQTI